MALPGLPGQRGLRGQDWIEELHSFSSSGSPGVEQVRRCMEQHTLNKNIQQHDPSPECVYGVQSAGQQPAQRSLSFLVLRKTSATDCQVTSGKSSTAVLSGLFSCNQ